MSRPLGLAVIGAGRIGARHAENAARTLGARLVGVADPELERAESVAGPLGARATPSVDELLAWPEVEAVVIAAPSDRHAELVERAAASGRAVLCEKPLAPDLAGCRRAVAAAESAGVALQLGFNRRFDPAFRAVAEAELGARHLLRITSRDPAPPPLAYLRTSGGLFLDMAIHDLDLARFLMADEVVEIGATGAVRLDPGLTELGDVDTAVVTLRFAGGALGVVDLCRRASYGYDQRVEVLGEAGLAFADNPLSLAGGRADAGGYRRPPLPRFFLERYAEAFRLELHAFVDAVRSGRPPEVDGRDGLLATQLAVAAGRALRLGRPVSPTEIDPEPDAPDEGPAVEADRTARAQPKATPSPR